jgi:hypothetical protein
MSMVCTTTKNGFECSIVDQITQTPEEPSIDDFEKDMPVIPPHFGEIVLNTDIKQVDPYMLPIPQHVTVNHTYL